MSFLNSLGINMNFLNRLLGRGGLEKFNIGDRVHIKGDTVSRKRGCPDVFVIMDVHEGAGCLNGYKIIKEGTCSTALFFRDWHLRDATGAPRNEIDLLIQEITERQKKRRTLAV